MSVSGGPTRPLVLVQNASAIATGATQTSAPVSVEDFDVAYLQVFSDQALSLTLRGSGALNAPATCSTIVDYSGGGAVALNSIAVAAAAANGQGFIIPCLALRWLQVVLVNSSGSTATVTVTVTLGRRGRG